MLEFLTHYLYCLFQISCEPNLPSKVCNECVEQLLNAVAFRSICIQSEKQLTEDDAEDFVLPDNPRASSPESQFLLDLGQKFKSEAVKSPEYILEDFGPIKRAVKKKKIPEKLIIFSKPTPKVAPQQTKRIKIEELVNVKFENDPEAWDGEYAPNVEIYETADFTDEFTGYEALEETYDEISSEQMQMPIFPPGGPFTCEPCGVSYTKKSSFSTHWHFKHKYVNRKFVCPDCGKIYHKTDQFKGHLNTHLHVLPYECDICGNRTARKHALAKHMMVHTGVKPYRCEFCGKSFSFSIGKMKFCLKPGMLIFPLICFRFEETPDQSHRRLYLQLSVLRKRIQQEEAASRS